MVNAEPAIIYQNRTAFHPGIASQKRGVVNANVRHSYLPYDWSPNKPKLPILEGLEGDGRWTVKPV